MSKRHRLIRTTLALCSVPVLIAGVILLVRRGGEAPYVPGQEQEGITRRLDRSLDPALSGIRFTEVTAEAGIRFDLFPFRRTSQLPEDMASGVAWGDYDGDGLPDLFLVNFAAPVGTSDAEMAASAATDRLYRNRGDGTFEDVTDRAGVGAAHRGMGAAWGDYDGDGDLDLVVSSWGENILWQNQGDGTFVDVAEEAGLGGAGFWAGVSWSDFDRDGDLDLYVCGYVHYTPEEPGSPMTRAGPGDFPFTLNPSSYPPAPNRLYVNRGDGTFEDRAAAAGVLGELGRSLSAAWVDLDADDLPDLYVANDVSDNNLYRNLGDGTFEDISHAALVADYRGAMAVAVTDWDEDLDLDLFIPHWIAQENALYTNQLMETAAGGGTGSLFFGDDADRTGLGQISLDLIGWGAIFADLDLDGREDLFISNGSTFQERHDPTLLVPMHPHLYWNRGAEEGFFEVGEAAGLRTDPPGVGRGAAFADYDGDGDLDLVILRLNGPARLLRNDSRIGHRIGFRFSAVSGHPSGRGARVVVHASGRSLLREAGAGAPYLSQNDATLLVGLGDATGVDSVEVYWPAGGRDVWRRLDADRLWQLTEGGEPRVLAAWAPPGEAGPRVAGRPTSGVAEHAIVSSVTSELSREDQLRFWEAQREAVRLFNEACWEEAADAYARALELDPEHEGALYDRGNTLLELERYEEAMASWRRLLELHPASSRAWVQIGVLQTMPEAGSIFDLEAAMAAFDRAHRINREESRPLMLGGEAALALGDLEAADRLLESARRMNPQVASPAYLGGYIAWKSGDRDRARELLEQAAANLDATAPGGQPGEGDTRSDRMLEYRRQAALRRLFGGCIDALRRGPRPPDAAQAFGCVEREFEALRERPG